MTGMYTQDIQGLLGDHTAKFPLEEWDLAPTGCVNPAKPHPHTLASQPQLCAVGLSPGNGRVPPPVYGEGEPGEDSAGAQ